MKQENPYRVATKKDLEKLLKTMSDDGEILSHDPCNGGHSTCQIGRIRVENGNLIID